MTDEMEQSRSRGPLNEYLHEYFGRHFDVDPDDLDADGINKLAQALVNEFQIIRWATDAPIVDERAETTTHTPLEMATLRGDQSESTVYGARDNRVAWAWSALVETWVATWPHSDKLSLHERTLIIGNLYGYTGWLRTRLVVSP